MKARIGVDKRKGTVHTVTSTAANVANVIKVTKGLTRNDAQVTTLFAL